MALFYQHNINGHTRLGIWKIEEDENFYLEKVPLKRDVSHPYKRLQHLAGRYLLRILFEDFPLEEILIADTKKPFLQDEIYHFSISHCGNYAAAIVSKENRVGVDIEMVTPRLLTISSKFLNQEETSYIKDWEHVSKLHLDLVTILWCAKESVFKWYGHGQVDFKKHMSLQGPMSFTSSEKVQLPFVFQKDAVVPLTVEAKIFDPLVLAWVVTEP